MICSLEVSKFHSIWLALGEIEHLGKRCKRLNTSSVIHLDFRY